MTEDINDDVSTGTEEDERKIPEKFQGKSVEEIIDMYSNLEKDHSRLGNDLGTYRKLTDKLLQADLEKPAPKQPEEEPDWEYEPGKAAESLVKKEVGQLKSELDKTKTELALKDFKTKYPTYDKDASTPEFMEWVQKSQYRINLYNKNYQGIDLEAADELMSGWEEYKSIKSQNSTVAEEKKKEDLKAASLEKSASSGGSRKKIWSRNEIIQMKLHDKPRYEAHRNEISAAYREGRVTK